MTWNLRLGVSTNARRNASVWAWVRLHPANSASSNLQSHVLLVDWAARLKDRCKRGLSILCILPWLLPEQLSWSVVRKVLLRFTSTSLATPRPSRFASANDKLLPGELSSSRIISTRLSGRLKLFKFCTTRFQLILPVDSQKPPNFTPVIEW